MKFESKRSPEIAAWLNNFSLGLTLSEQQTAITDLMRNEKAITAIKNNWRLILFELIEPIKINLERIAYHDIYNIAENIEAIWKTLLNNLCTDKLI